MINNPIEKAISDCLHRETKTIKETIDTANKRMVLVEKGLLILSNRKAQITEALEKVNLVVEEPYPNPFQFTAAKDGNPAMVTFEFRAKSNGKFKFLKFHGYTARGAGRNESQLKAKADRIESKIKEITQCDFVGVNSCSLEYKGDTAEDKSVLIYIRFNIPGENQDAHLNQIAGHCDERWM